MTPRRQMPAGPAPEMGLDERSAAPFTIMDPVATYVRSERWETPPAPGDGAASVVSARIPLDPHLIGVGGGIRTGVLLIAVDTVGGMMSGLAVLPQWVVTTSMMATVVTLDHRGPVRLEGRILRRGRSTVVSAVDVVDEGAGARTVAAVTTTFAVLEPRGFEFAFDRPVSLPAPPPEPDPPGPEEFFGIVPGRGPVTGLDLAPHLRNPWGILHGGAVAVLVDEAACRAVAGAVDGPAGPVATAGTVLDYLRPVRVGPVAARCTALVGPPGRRVVRVAVHDVGADDRLCALAMVTVLAVTDTGATIAGGRASRLLG